MGLVRWVRLDREGLGIWFEVSFFWLRCVGCGVEDVCGLVYINGGTVREDAEWKLGLLGWMMMIYDMNRLISWIELD